MPNQNLVTKKSMELGSSKSSFATNKKKEALDKFKSMPMPKERDDDWRYTQIDKLKLENFERCFCRQRPAAGCRGQDTSFCAKHYIKNNI